jgi:hypothetical protein
LAKEKGQKKRGHRRLFLDSDNRLMPRGAGDAHCKTWDCDMAKLDRNQINIVHTHLADGRSLTRLIHLPTGCYAESFGTREPIIRMIDRLIQELEAKVK